MLSEKSIIRADILTPDFIEISSYRRDKIVQVDRSHSIMQCEEDIKVILQKTVVTLENGNTLELVRPRNRSNAVHYDSMIQLMA